MTVYSDRFRFPAKGLFGGHDGTCSYIKIKRAGSDKEEYLKPKGEDVLHKGDILEIGIGGGAGYGKPLERNRENLQADLITGKVSKKAAKNIYGY